MTKDLDATTKKEWRELGFYYDFDEQHFHWRLIGSKSGLLGFARLIDAYVSDPRNQKLSEHEHYGPYAYLKLMTAAEPQITESWICGRLSDLEKLSAIVKEHLHRSEVGSTFTIGDEHVAGSKTVIQFECARTILIQHLKTLVCRVNSFAPTRYREVVLTSSRWLGLADIS